MKPRTKLHHRIVDLASYLPTITNEAKDWAYKTTLEHRGYQTKNRVLCLDCGETFSPTLVSRKKAVCPHCETKIQVKESRCTTDTQTNYFAICDIVQEFQVVRNFELIAYYKKGKKASYYLHEIIQYWIDPNLKVTMFGKCHTTQGYCDSWGGPMEIRKESRNYYSNKKYEVYARFYYPKSVIKTEYLKFGINYKLNGLTFLEAITKIPNNPKLETLLKAKQYSLLSKSGNYALSRYWPSIKICLRNKYNIKDAGIWLDYLDLLSYFNKDLRNPKYVCPKNLKKEHDKLVVKKRVIQKKLEWERQRKEVKQAQNKYYKDKKAFFDLMFSKGKIVIVPLKSVQEFMEEGDTLKHCVFTNKYYNKTESLILSARINDKPIETIEINLTKLKIEQSRGLHNQQTEHHDKIVNLVKKNLPKIAKIAKQTAA